MELQLQSRPLIGLDCWGPLLSRPLLLSRAPSAILKVISFVCTLWLGVQGGPRARAGH